MLSAFNRTCEDQQVRLKATCPSVMIRDVIKIMAEYGVRNRMKVIIGGGPTTQEYADAIVGEEFSRFFGANVSFVTKNAQVRMFAQHIKSHFQIGHIHRRQFEIEDHLAGQIEGIHQVLPPTVEAAL